MGLTSQRLQQLGGSQAPTAPIGQPAPSDTSFMRRLALSFGGKEANEERQRIETSKGVAGKFDIGDIADIAGGAIPLAASIAGGIFGNVGGAALGAAGGEAARRGIGKALGVNKESLSKNIEAVAKEGAYTYVGGKILSGAGKLIAKTGAFKALPERLYSTFFKTTADDLSNLARTGAIQNLQSTDPELFGKLVKEGIVRTGKAGTVEINPTLAQEALVRGLGSKGGSLEKMAEYSIQKQMELELAARAAARNAPKLVTLENAKGYVNMLKDVSGAFKKEGYGFLSNSAKEADSLAKVITKSNGKVPAETALKLRRLIDGLRNTSSFRSSPILSPKQAIFKEGADSLRRKIAEVPGMKEIMNEYRFNIEAADTLVSEAAKRGNTRILSLFDAVVGGSSIGAVGPAGLGIWAGLRTIQTPAILTAIARGLYKLPELGAKTLPYITEPTGKVIRKIIE